MRLALGLASAIDRLTAALGRGAAWLALAIVLVQFGLVVARYVFSAGSVPATESVIYGQALLVTLTAAWTLAAGGHVRVDIFYAEASPRRRAWVDLVGTLVLLLPFMLTLLWLSVPYAAVIRFYDPHAAYVLQFEPPAAAEAPAAVLEAKPDAPPPEPAALPAPSAGGDEPKIVSLDQFRKK